MFIDWSRIPDEFHYLRNQALDRFGADCRILSFDESLGRHVMPAEKLTTDELKELASVFDELRRRDDNFRIIDWIDSVPYGTAKYDSAWVLHGLLFLLANLAKRGIEPFCQHEVFVEHSEPPLDWRTLPSELSFVKEAVERYSSLQSEARIVDWLSSATPDDLRELEKLAKQIRPKRKAIDKWQEQQRETREGFIVGWLFLILFHAGIKMG